ncbi:TULIP family P47-like protein [Chryseobacterium culicis]|uniref:TULIP family P47-like protein n=1 Tax=Chryseobacterium culicis TaxID=680127 RepID=UPI00187568FE|nr:TULIP family P47-like protein [Chryseobacterium culicis]MBE4947964.1 TULIP family P47-like protein [Chryseobacterium culicis]
MATVMTQGWDLVAVATQTLLNELIEVAYNDNLFPSNVNTTISGITFDGSFGVPTTNLNPSQSSGTNSMASIEVPISGTLTSSGISHTIPPDSTLLIVSNLSYVSITLDGTSAVRLYLDLASQLATYTVSIQPPQGWVAMLNGIIQYYLQNLYTGGSYYLGTVNMEGVPAAVLPTGSVHFATQPNTSDASSNILAMVANTSTGSPGTLNFSGGPALLPSDQNAALYISNRCILNNMLLPVLATQLNTAASSFTVTGNSSTPYNVSLNTSVNLDGEYDPKLTSMNNYVNNSGQIQSDYGAVGYPISAFSSLIWINVSGHIYLTPTLSGQTISFDVDAPSGSGSAALSAGGWAIVGALIIATFGTLGACVAAVVAIVVPIVVTQLKFNISMSQVGANIGSASTSFNWPAATIAPLTSVTLPGDLILYVDPQV